MYDIWLIINIAFEFLLPFWPYMLLVVALAAYLLVRASKDPRTCWRGTFKWGIGLSLLVAAVCGAVLPSLTHSSFAEMGYWLDWAFWLGQALSLGTLAFVVLFPLCTLWVKNDK